MRTYRAITKMLKEDKNLSLSLYFTDMSYRIENFRTASIDEPDPHEGEVANPESGLDQRYLHGPRREKDNFNFKAKHSMQALNLLERTCNGKKGLGNTVKGGTGNQWSPGASYVAPVDGYQSPKPGLDAWVFNEFSFDIQQKENENLFLDIKSRNFSVSGFPISSKQINDVREGIALYEENIVDNSIIRNLQKGILLRAGILQCADLKLDEGDISQMSEGIVTQEFLDKYHSALESLTPFNVSQKAQDGLFTAMLLDNFYSDK